MNIEEERARLIELRRSAMVGLPENVLDAISLLKDRGVLSRSYDPKKHYLRWRAFGEGVKRLAMYDFPDEDECEEKPK